MKLIGNLKCPECGEPIMGSVDLVPGCALMTVQSDGTFDWAGGTEMFWDGQHNVEPDPKKMRVQCHEGHAWLVAFTEGE